ncbi:acetyltransferase [Sabulilitoribacter multivorans]|uniref:Acetyltransferase n=1 Tax=Flaviramulus multivorans TaxID=1304750 RepID=A0ABS9IIM7_9FLAO|nr:acetyltransferase [Flaviramulus multivorans]MCF7560005.1 acetyltransferase [Flaviramulus multivorans]
MSENREVRLYGAGGHSQVIQSVLKQNGYTISDLFDDNPKNSHKLFKDVKHGVRSHKSNFPHQGVPFIIGVGDNYQRFEIAKILKSEFSKAIHKSAIIDPSVSIDDGTVVYAGSTIQTNASIGKHVIINTMSSVDHDSIIQDFVHISPNATICGLVNIGIGTHIGAGAVVIPQVKIGKWCIIGAGTVVLKDIPDYSVVVGNPGKIIKKNIIKNLVSA